jgi:hypothetical protein
VMLVAGSLASHLHTVRTMANHLNKTKSTLVLIDGVGDVLNEAVSPCISRSILCAAENGLTSLTLLYKWPPEADRALCLLNLTGHMYYYSQEKMRPAVSV